MRTTFEELQDLNELSDLREKMKKYSGAVSFGEDTYKKAKELSREERLLISIMEILKQSNDPDNLLSSAIYFNYLLDKEGKQ